MKLRYIFILSLIFLIVPTVNALEITVPQAKLVNGCYYIVKGQTADITIKGSPNEKVNVEITYKFDLSASNGEYKFSQSGFPIPLNAKFTVKAYPVVDLTVKATIFLFLGKTLHATAKDGVAVVSANVPKGSYDIELYGKTDSSIVHIECIAKTTITLNGNGEYVISYDTSKLPVGYMTVNANGIIMNARIVSSESEIPIPTPTTPPPTPTTVPTTTSTPIVTTTVVTTAVTTMPPTTTTVVTTPKSTTKPDLVIDKLFRNGDKIIVNVANKGNETAKNFEVCIYLNSKLIGKKLVSSLEGGESLNMSFKIPIDFGKFVISAVVDPKNAVKELNESNNKKTLSFTITSPDVNVEIYEKEDVYFAKVTILTPNTCYRLNWDNLTHNGSTFSVRVNISITNKPCLQVLNKVTKTFKLGKLNSGVYHFIVYIDHKTFSKSFRVIKLKSLNVTLKNYTLRKNESFNFTVKIEPNPPNWKGNVTINVEAFGTKKTFTVYVNGSTTFNVPLKAENTGKVKVEVVAGNVKTVKMSEIKIKNIKNEKTPGFDFILVAISLLTACILKKRI